MNLNTRKILKWNKEKKAIAFHMTCSYFSSKSFIKFIELYAKDICYSIFSEARAALKSDIIYSKMQIDLKMPKISRWIEVSLLSLRPVMDAMSFCWCFYFFYSKNQMKIRWKSYSSTHPPEVICILCLQIFYKKEHFNFGQICIIIPCYSLELHII